MVNDKIYFLHTIFRDKKPIVIDNITNIMHYNNYYNISAYDSMWRVNKVLKNDK